jgi:YhcH/YjgK/YiaL family protein
MIQTYQTEPEGQRTFEAHKKYIDIQYILSGRELILYKETSVLKHRKPYDPDRDVIFLEDVEAKQILLESGDFVIFWPQDAHKPGCMAHIPSEVRKIVAKIRLPEHRVQPFL